ncbi:hypothetical protein BJ912DRAFT_943150 [Pholiota molesta]|nr:hypothetical protein BJ912DRAFT_943150 [Pholiota molesta]
MIPAIDKSKFTLDVSGIAGVLGGEESFAAMSSVHLMRGRRWLGLYNSPGSYHVAKKYGALSRLRCPTVEPAEMLELDSKKGPRYMGVQSGTRLAETGHLSYLLARHCEQKVDAVPEDFFSPFNAWGFVPTIATLAFAIAAGIARDRFCCAMIVLGALCNGVSCWIIGSGILELHCPEPSTGSPPGDGVLVAARDIIILEGSEHIVSHVIRGRFQLQYESAPKYMDIGFCSFLLTAQFIVQLFLVPQGVLFGQIMFLSTFVVSWSFNAYLASVDRDTLQTNVLLQALGKPKFTKFSFDKWYTAAAFTACYLHSDILEELVPNKTPAWDICRRLTREAISRDCDPTKLLQSEQGKAALESLKIGSDREFVVENIKRAAQAYTWAKSFKHKDVQKTVSTARPPAINLRSRPIRLLSAQEAEET